MAPSAARFALKPFRDDAEEAAEAAEIEAARVVFAQFVALEAAFDPAVIELYADDGIVIERQHVGGVERRAREIPMKRYKAVLARALSKPNHAPEMASHAQVQLERIAPGWVSVRTVRRSSASRAAAPYELLLRRGGDGAWRIVKEAATVAL